jgi:hypothetical protein
MLENTETTIARMKPPLNDTRSVGHPRDLREDHYAAESIRLVNRPAGSVFFC